MNTYNRHRFPPDIISYFVWFYYRFNLSYRGIEDLLAEREIAVSREAIRLWYIKFGAIYARVIERGIGRFKSVGQAQRLRGVLAALSNLFNLGRHQVSLTTIETSGVVRSENGVGRPFESGSEFPFIEGG